MRLEPDCSNPFPSHTLRFPACLPAFSDCRATAGALVWLIPETMCEVGPIFTHVLKEQTMREDDTAARLAALLAGLGVGAIVAILATPRSGEEIRERIAEKTNQGKDYAKQKAGQLARQVEDSVKDVQDAVQVGKGVYREQISQARAGQTNRQTDGTD